MNKRTFITMAAGATTSALFGSAVEPEPFPSFFEKIIGREPNKNENILFWFYENGIRNFPHKEILYEFIVTLLHYENLILGRKTLLVPHFKHSLHFRRVMYAVPERYRLSGRFWAAIYYHPNHLKYPNCLDGEDYKEFRHLIITGTEHFDFDTKMEVTRFLQTS